MLNTLTATDIHTDRIADAIACQGGLTPLTTLKSSETSRTVHIELVIVVPVLIVNHYTDPVVVRGSQGGVYGIVLPLQRTGAIVKTKVPGGYPPIPDGP
jgi:hypothetical protein